MKNALFLWVHLPASNISKIVMGTLLDNLFEIDAIIGDIIFFTGLLIAFYIQWQIQHLFGATVEEKTRAWWHQVHKQGFTNFYKLYKLLYKFLLGTSGVIQVQSKLRHSKFIQMEELCPQYINKSSWFSGWSFTLKSQVPSLLHPYFFLLN